MVTVVQIARAEEDMFDILSRSGYDVSARDRIVRQANRARIWLNAYAPPMVKFAVQNTLPPEAGSLGNDERLALEVLLARYTGLDSWKAEELHNLIYTVGEETGVAPKSIFSAVYTILLGQKRGPRLGWFLEALGREFVEKRMLEAVNTGAE